MATPEQLAAVQTFRDSLIAASVVSTLAEETAKLYDDPAYWAQTYHDSALTGQAWVDELIKGHPNRILTELGVRLHVLMCLLAKLVELGYTDSQNGVTLREQLAIFLYICVTSLSSRYVGERFQHSNETIT